MPENIEKRIKNIEETLQENNEMLHKIRRREIWSFWFGIIKLLVFVGFFYYGYLLLEPYLQQLKEVYSSVQGFKDDALNVDFNGINISEFIKSFSGSSE